MGILYELRYTKAIQAVLSTESGKTVVDMLGMSIPAVGSRIEVYAKNLGDYNIKKTYGPQAAAYAAVVAFGMYLAEFGETELQRLAGSALQMALIEYGRQNPAIERECAPRFLSVWLASRPHARRKPGLPKS